MTIPRKSIQFMRDALIGDGVGRGRYHFVLEITGGPEKIDAFARVNVAG